VDRVAVPYYRSDLDITDRVIQLYNAGEGASGATTPEARRASRSSPEKGEQGPAKAPPKKK